MSDNQQIVISGLGGQGVLFITKLLAGAAMAEDVNVLTSETHGMAQRGGNVISYVKTGDFASPLIRPGKADALIALKEESFHHHGYLVKDGGFGVVNSPSTVETAGKGPRVNVYCADAQALAERLGAPQSVNVAMLGFFAAAIEKQCGFLSLNALSRAVREKFEQKPKIMSGILGLLEAGYKLLN